MIGIYFFFVCDANAVLYCRNSSSQLSDRCFDFLYDHGADEKMASASTCDAYSTRVAHTQRVVGITSAVGTSRSCSRHTNKSEENLGVRFFGSPVRRNYHSKGVLVVLVTSVENQSLLL